MADAAVERHRDAIHQSWTASFRPSGPASKTCPQDSTGQGMPGHQVTP